jgi:hypothetical protein
VLPFHGQHAFALDKRQKSPIEGLAFSALATAEENA